MRNGAMLLLLLSLPIFFGGCTQRTMGDTAPAREVTGVAGSGLFSASVRTGDLIFLSGVIGRSDEGIQEATRQSLRSVRERIEAAGATMADLVQCTVLLIDIDDYQGMNEAYLEFFPSDPPARTAVAVQALPANAQVEVACIAAAP